MLKRYLAFPGQSLLALEYGVGLARTWPSGGVPDLATWCPEFLQPFSQITSEETSWKPDLQTTSRRCGMVKQALYRWANDFRWWPWRCLNVDAIFHYFLVIYGNGQISFKVALKCGSWNSRKQGCISDAWLGQLGLQTCPGVIITGEWILELLNNVVHVKDTWLLCFQV